MEFCKNAVKAIIEIVGIEKLTSLQPPIQINYSRNPDIKCFKVIGYDYYNRYAPFYQCARTAEIVQGEKFGAIDVSQFPHKNVYGCVPFFDGSPWFPGVQGRYQKGATIKVVSSESEPGVLNSSCNSCLQSCSIEIKDKSGIIFTKNFAVCPDYKVSCDDDCPTGFCKCIINKYPGYCCLDCRKVAAQINNLATKCKC